jgi:hypothetical protein
MGERSAARAARPWGRATGALVGCALASCALVASCAGTRGDRPEAVPRHTALPSRVLEVLHGTSADAEPSPPVAMERAVDAVLHALDPATGCASMRAQLVARGDELAAALAAGEHELMLDAARACAQRAPSEATLERIALDALVKVFDPRGAFVPAEGMPALLAARASAAHAIAGGEARGRVVEHAGRRLGLIVLTAFHADASGRDAARDVRYLVGALQPQGAGAFVLDLRGNPGGAIEQAQEVAAALGISGPFAWERSKGGAERRLHVPEDRAAYRGPLALVVDAHTRGVAEVFAAAAQDRARGPLVGARTAGEASSQALVELRSARGSIEGGVLVTDRKWQRASRSAIEGRGVTPDAPAEGEAAIARAAELLAAQP